MDITVTEIMELADMQADSDFTADTPADQLPRNLLERKIQEIFSHIAGLEAQVWQCGAGAGCCAQAARIEELEAQAYDRHAAALCSAARVMDLEAQLEAVGAGGVGPLLGAPAQPVAPSPDATFEMWRADHMPNSGREQAWTEWCALWPSQPAAQPQENANAS